jgi:hypothetical protein
MKESANGGEGNGACEACRLVRHDALLAGRPSIAAKRKSHPQGGLDCNV